MRAMLCLKDFRWKTGFDPETETAGFLLGGLYRVAAID